MKIKAYHLKKKRYKFDPWYREILKKFNGDQGKADAHIVENVLHYEITTKNHIEKYNQHPELKDWPSYRLFPRHIKKEVMRQRVRNQATFKNAQDWFNELADIYGDRSKALDYIVKTILKYKVNMNNYRIVYDKNLKVFENWPSLPTIYKHFSKIAEKVNLKRYGRAHFTKLDIQAWYKDMLKLNWGSVEVTNTTIAKIVVRFNVTINNYKEIYDQHPEVFAGWPILESILKNHSEIRNKIQEIRELLKQQEQILQ